MSPFAPGQSPHLLPASIPDLTDKIVPPNNWQYYAGGAFGDVFRCRYTSDNGVQEVAVKAFRFSFCVDDVERKRDEDKAARMIHRELGIWRRLSHRNIVPFLGITYGFGKTGNASLVSMWMPHGTLHAFLEAHANQLTVAHRIQLLLDIANGLDYLHSFPMVHGDLSSNNVLLDRNGNACLTDFGCASLIGELPEGLTYLKASTIRPGTLRWAAPEHLSPSQDGTKHTTKSDIYSLGNMALLVLSGKYPWSEVQHDALIVLNLFQGVKPARPRARPIDDQHWALIEQCWSAIPERPFAAEVAASLERFLCVYPHPLLLRVLSDIPTPSSSVPDHCNSDNLCDDAESTRKESQQCLTPLWQAPAVSPSTDNIDRMDPFAEGLHYGPVLEPFLAKIVGAVIKLNPLLAPPADTQDDYLRWNMLFHTSNCYRTTESQRAWIKGRNAPATHPRLSHIRIICRLFPWMMHVRAQNAKLGVTCGEVLDAISAYMYGDVVKQEYEPLRPKRMRQIWENYRFNRSTDSKVPGGRLGEALTRLDWLGNSTQFGGLVVNESFVEEHCGDVLPSFELNCLQSYPPTAEEVRERRRRLKNPQRHRPATDRRNGLMSSNLGFGSTLELSEEESGSSTASDD